MTSLADYRAKMGGRGRGGGGRHMRGEWVRVVGVGLMLERAWWVGSSPFHTSPTHYHSDKGIISFDVCQGTGNAWEFSALR